MKLARTWSERLEKTQEALLKKVMNMKFKELVLDGLMDDRLECSMTYMATFDRNGNLTSIRAEIAGEFKKKYASSGKAQNGQKFRVYPGQWDKTLKAIQGTTPAALEVIEEMKQIIQARKEARNTES